MADRSDLSEGMSVQLTGRPASGGTQDATVVDVGDVRLRIPGDGPRTSGTTHSNTALLKDDNGRYVVAQLSDIEIP